MPLQFLDGVPELGTLGFNQGGEEFVITQILSFKEIHPEALLILI
jgi:hypothetical protein